MDVKLTNDSERLIAVMYKNYLDKRKSGKSKSESNYFSDSHVIHQNLIPEWCFEDVDDTCRELSRAGLINCRWADNIAIYISISDEGLIHMENRFKNGLKSVIDFLSQFIP